MEREALPPRLYRYVARAIRVTYLGVWTEAVVRAFWPAFTVVSFGAGLVLLGAPDILSPRLFWAFFATLGMTAIVLFGLGLRGFDRPSRAQAAARVDAQLAGRPIQALADSPALAPSETSSALWQAHLGQMRARLAQARAVAPDLRLSDRDPFALRLMALTILAMGLIFGSVEQARLPVTGAEGERIAQGPNWEGWVKPPAHTGKPTLYLADLEDGFDTPKGAEVVVRLYGDEGVLTLRETVSGAEETTGTFSVAQSGDIEIDGPTGRLWNVALVPDAPPQAELVGDMTRGPTGETRQEFRLTDDFGVARAVMAVRLNAEAVARRYGFVLPPEPRPSIDVPVALPQTGGRTVIEALFAENFSEHPFSGLPVRISLRAWDQSGQASNAATGQGVLPGRRFFDPLAGALIDVRRELLWNRANAPRASQVLRAVSVNPDEVFDNLGQKGVLDGIISRLEARPDPMPDALLDALAKELWDLAVLLEDGELQQALERLRRAQERLQEAMRDGATPEEIARLMEELREATRDYMQQLAENAEPGENGTDQPDRGEQGQTITQDQIQALMDQIQELMEQGRMAEAQQLLDMLAQMLENMRMTQGEGQGQGDQAMDGLRGMMQDQQSLNDDTFRDLQEQFDQSQGSQEQQGQQGPNGQQGSDGAEAQPDPEGGNGDAQADGRSLAERQRDLRDQLEAQRRSLPLGGGGDEESADQALEDAGRAMDEAQDQLEEGDLAGALDSQAEAMESLREGMRRLGQQMAQNGPQQDGQQGTTGGSDGTDGDRRDPLGRSTGDAGRFGSDEGFDAGEDVYRRAEELLDEIRRRSAERERPQDERDYLERLLDNY